MGQNVHFHGLAQSRIALLARSRPDGLELPGTYRQLGHLGFAVVFLHRSVTVLEPTFKPYRVAKYTV